MRNNKCFIYTMSIEMVKHQTAVATAMTIANIDIIHSI